MINEKTFIKKIKENREGYNFVLTLNKKDFYELKNSSNVCFKDGTMDNIFGIKIVCMKGIKKSKIIYLGKDNKFAPNYVGDLE